MEKISKKVFKTLEANQLRMISGGSSGPTNTLPGITVYSNGSPATVDSPGNPNDGIDKGEQL